MKSSSLCSLMSGASEKELDLIDDEKVFLLSEMAPARLYPNCRMLYEF